MKDYPGSKGGEGVWQRIISEMPPHETYIEAFLGTGVIMERKRPSTVTIGIDADPHVISAANARFGVERSCNFICGDARAVLPVVRHVPQAVLVYADPPYLFGVRSCNRRYYRQEFTDEDHVKLLALLKTLPCHVMLSGYWSELYERELVGWRTVQIPTVNHRGKRVIEWLWMNYPEPGELHDYRFLGGNHRERQRIKKRIRRWQGKLRKMPLLERAALLWACGSGNAQSGVPTGGNVILGVGRHESEKATL